MPGPAVIFKEIHRLRQNAAKLQAEIERLPKQAKTHQNRIARQEEIHKEAQDALKHLKVSILEKESSLKATHNLIAKHQKQLLEASAKKEFDALKTELGIEMKRAAELEEAILEGMSQSEESTAKLPELAANIKKAKDEATTFEKDMSARQAGLLQQLNAALDQLKQVEAGLHEDVRVNYERLVKAMGPDAMSAIKNRNCVACHTSLTAQDYNNLLSERMVSCKACGRIVYLSD